MRRKEAMLTTHLLLLSGLASGWAAQVSAPAQSGTGGRITTPWQLNDVSGQRHDLSQNSPGRARVFVFLTTECPIARSYTPTLNQLFTRFDQGMLSAQGDKRVDFFAVISDPSITYTAAAAHCAEFKMAYPVLFDADGLLAGALRPSHIPEAFVISPAGNLVYRGAIDNTWESVGRRRPRADQQYLAEALKATLAGKAPAVARTTPVGCPVERPGAPERIPGDQSR